MGNANVIHILVPLMIAVGLVVIVKALMGRPSGPTLDVRAVPLMSSTERVTLTYIESALPWARIHAQVSMGAILAPKKGLSRSRATTVRNRFSSRRIDYVVEDRASGAVVLLIELDDRSHRPDQDARRDKMTAAAGYSTLRLPASEKPTPQSVRRHIETIWGRHPELLPPSALRWRSNQF